jgi:hypothetical protein
VQLKFLGAFVLSLGVCALSTTRANADTVLYDGAGFITGTESFSQSFNLTAPGTLTVTLSDVAWPQKLASLDFLLSSASGTLGPEMSAGTYTFAVLSGGNVYAQWFGTAQGPLNAGAYSLHIDFAPSGIPVPLPTSAVLLLSGVALLRWHRRARNAEIRPQLRLVYKP